MSMSARTLLIGWSLVGCMLAAQPAFSQQPFPDSGNTAADITDQVNAFRAALDASGGRRQVVWDGVSDADAVPMPFDRFSAAGALFFPGAGGTSVQVSLNDPDDPNTIDGVSQFADLQPGYEQIFQPFSGDQIFTAIDTNVVEVRFVLPGTLTPGLTKGLGVVFSDVDLPNTTSIELFGPTNQSLGTYFVPAASGNQTFSFLGLLYKDAIISRALVTNGNFELGPDFSDGTDLVAMDDFIFGTPVQVPEPSTWLALLAGLAGLVGLRRKHVSPKA